MKRYIFSLFAIIGLSLIALCGCNTPNSKSANFLSEEYTLSVGESIDLKSQIKLNDINYEDVSFYSTDKNVLKIQDGKASAIASGESVIFASIGEENIASAKVFVKYQYQSASNVTLDENGFVTWKKPSLVYDGEIIYPSSYIVHLKDVTNIAPSQQGDIPFSSFESEYGFDFVENDFSFGQYLVVIEVVGDDFADGVAFDEKNAVTLNYGVIGTVTDITFIPSSDENKSATLKWSWQENAVYDIYLNGFIIGQDIATNAFTYSYIGLDEGGQYQLQIVASDISGTLLPTTTFLDLVVLDKTSPSFLPADSDNIDGKVAWQSVENAFGYYVILSDASSQKTILEYDIDKFQGQTLEGGGNGDKKLQVIAKGGYKDGVIYLNSFAGEEIEVCKLNKPSMSVTLNGEKALIEIEDDENNKKFVLRYGTEQAIFEGNSYEVDLASLRAGEYVFNLQALPTADDKNYLTSDTAMYEFVVLEDFSSFSHTLLNKTSTFQFNQIENANYYTISVNGEIVDDIGYSILGGKVVFKVDLSTIMPKENEYIVEFVAGRKVSGKENSVISTYKKTINVLSIITQADKQQNGRFSWNAIDNAEYEYKIIKYTDKTRQKIEKEYDFKTTKLTNTSENLTFGYYSIIIYTRSLNTSSYLDSDFYSQKEGEGYFKGDFIVTEQIESPRISFSCANGQNILLIEGVEFGGGYDIYIDGVKDGTIENNDDQFNQEIQYQFTNVFSEVKNYAITVNAHAGTKYDSTLHTKSNVSRINIERLPMPQFTVSEEYDPLTYAKTEELLNVAMIDNASKVDITLDGQQVNTDGENTVNMVDYSKFDNEFTLLLTFRAGENQGDQYYMDSLARAVNFERVASPTNFAYQDGQLSWTLNDERVQRFDLIIELTTTSTGSSYYKPTIEKAAIASNGGNYSLDIQSIIDNLISDEASNFSENYMRANSVKFHLVAHANKFNDEQSIYILPSFKGVTMLGKDFVEVERLADIALSFDPNTLILSWSSPAQDTKYNIYVDGVLKKQETSNQIDIQNLGLSFLTQKSVYIKGENSRFLDGENSNTIFITQLQSINKLTFVQESNVVSFDISTNLTNTKAVQINGSSDNVNYTPASTVGTFNPSDFEGDEFVFKVIAENNTDQTEYYYIDSAESIFIIANVDTQSLSININAIDNLITWNNAVPSMTATIDESNPVTYHLTIKNGEDTYTSLSTQGLSYSLENLERDLDTTFVSGDVVITVSAIIEDYSFSPSTMTAYYGTKKSNPITVQKLERVIVESDEIVITNPQNLADYLDAYVTYSFQNQWDSQAEIIVVINADSEREINFSINLDKNVNRNEGVYYSFIKSGQTCALSIYKDALLNQINSIQFVVKQNGTISSDYTYLNLSRMKNVATYSLNPEGIMTIPNNENKASVFVEISIGLEKITKTYSLFKAFEESYENLESIDIYLTNNGDKTGLLDGKSGNYTIKLVFFDSDMSRLPSESSYDIEGEKFSGISNISLIEEGSILIEIGGTTISGDNLEEYEFVVMYNNIVKTFTPRPYDISANSFRIGMLEIIQLFGDKISTVNLKFDFNVRKVDSIYGDWKSISFDYQLELLYQGFLKDQNLAQDFDYSKDYIFFSMDTEDTDNTSYFNIKIKNTLDESADIAYRYIDCSSVAGFLKKDAQNNNIVAFTNAEGANDGFNYQKVYALSINDLLKDYDYGIFEIELARIGQEGDTFIQYSSNIIQVMKLNQINENITIENNVLYWTWQATGITDAQYAPKGYYVELDVYSSAIIGTEKDTTITYFASTGQLDLNQTEILKVGKYYKLRVYAISSSSNIITSNSREYAQTISKNYTPAKVIVKDGKLLFDTENFTLKGILASGEVDIVDELQKMLDNTPLNELEVADNEIKTDDDQELAIPTTFSYPLHFDTNQVGNTTNIRLTFTNSSNRTYSITVSAVHLFNYIELSYYEDSTAQSQETKTTASLASILNTLYAKNPDKSANLKSLADFLNSSNYGIGVDSILFDDYGNRVPSGEYNLTASHIGVVAGNIDSNGTEATKVYLISAPEILLDNDSDGYFVRVRTTTLSDGSEVERYKMVFRYNYQSTVKLYGDEDLMAFDIEKVDSGWQIKLNGTVIEYDINENQINDVISTVTVPGDSRSYFKINFSALRDALNFSELGLRELNLNKDIRVDIYAVAPEEENNDDNVYVLNGKSAHFNLHFLNLDANSISFENGQMSIEVIHNPVSPNTLLLRYRTIDQGESSVEIIPDGQDVNLSSTSATINLPYDGQYQYIVISLDGAKSSDYLKVESKSYAIENLYKMDAPTLSVLDNNLEISLGSNELNIIDSMKLKLGSSEKAIEEGATYEYRDIGSSYDSSSIVYQVGIDEREINARSFSSYLLGNSGKFTFSPDAQANYSHNADYIWTFASENTSDSKYANYVIFSSKAEYINAQMLNIIKSSSISNGNYTWLIQNELPYLQNNAQIIYQIDIDYYVKNNRLVNGQVITEYNYDSTETYYTTNKTLSYIYFSNDFDYYIINLTALAGVKVDASTTTVPYIQTVEGETFDINSTVYYENDLAVLRNRTITLGTVIESGSGNLITRSQSPILSTNSYGINNGIIEFTLPNLQLQGSDGGYSVDTLQKSLAVRAVYGQTNIELEGNYTFTSSSNGIMVQFALEEHQIDSSSLTIEIYFTETGKLMSKPLTISNVYKLSDISESYYSIGMETAKDNSGRTYIDFTQYFSNFRYSGSNLNYKIVINESIKDESLSPELTAYSEGELITTELTADSPRYYLTSNTKIQIQVCDAQGQGAVVGRLLFLYSNTLTLDILETTVKEGDIDLISISWDEVYNRFTWDLKGAAVGEEYDYYYYLRYSSGSVEQGITTNQYYMPTQAERIATFYIQARNREYEEKLYVFSSPLTFLGTVTPSLYSGGEGSETNPYIITTDTDFYNIFLRNSAGERYYFILNANIDVDIANMIKHVEESGGKLEDILSFYGHLSGNGKTITINASTLRDMQSSYSKVVTGLGSDGITFNNYIALFHTLDSQASIENLNVKFNINFEMQKATNAIISSLVLYNYGTISGVTINSIDITSLTSTALSTSNIMLGGIAGINLGDIIECNDKANFTYITQSNNIMLGYAGIAAFNDVMEGDAGRIIYSFSQGNKTVNIQSANAIALLSGITLNNYSLISSSGNSSNFTVTNNANVSSFTVYMSGISILNSNGTLNYLYNTGKFTRSNVGTIYTSAISYSVVGGMVNTLIDTTSSPLVVSCTIAPTVQGTLYADQSAGTNQKLPTEALPTQSLTITTDQGYVLRIVPTTSTVRVTISKS